MQTAPAFVSKLLLSGIFWFPPCEEESFPARSSLPPPSPVPSIIPSPVLMGAGLSKLSSYTRPSTPLMVPQNPSKLPPRMLRFSARHPGAMRCTGERWGTMLCLLDTSKGEKMVISAFNRFTPTRDYFRAAPRPRTWKPSVPNPRVCRHRATLDCTAWQVQLR